MNPLRHPPFRRFFIGRAASLLGSAMTPVALAFAVLDATDDVGALSVVLAAQSVPMVALLLVGGAVADRFRRSTVLAVANLGAGLSQGAVAVLLLTGGFQLGAVLVPVVLNGAFAAFTGPALRGAVPQLVSGPAAIRRANALLSTTRSAARVAGPSVAGLLVATVGGGWALAGDALGYLVAAACTATVRLPAPPPADRVGLLTGIRQGWTEFRALRWVRTVVPAFAALNFVLAGVWLVLGPTISRESAGEAAWGLALSVRAVGLLLAGAVMYRITLRYLLRAGQLAAALPGVAFLALAFDTTGVWLCVGAFVAGVGSAVGGIAWDTSLQEHVPGAVLSRVASYDDLGSYLAVPLGQLLVVPIAAALGDRTTAAAGGVIYVLLALAVLAAPSVRNLPHSPGGERA